MQKHPLPPEFNHGQPDGWLELRDQDEISVRARRSITAISLTLGDAMDRLQHATPDTNVATLGFNEYQADAFLRIQEASVVAFLAGWSRPEPVPTQDTIGDLPDKLYRFLSEATASLGAQVALDTRATADPTDGSPSGGSRLAWALEGMLGAEVDPEVSERYKSFQYRKLMGVSEQQYLETAAITVDWDIEFNLIEDKIREKRSKET